MNEVTHTVHVTGISWEKLESSGKHVRDVAILKDSSGWWERNDICYSKNEMRENFNSPVGHFLIISLPLLSKENGIH